MQTSKKLYQENQDYKEKSGKVISNELRKTAPLLSFEFQKQAPGEHWITIGTPEYTSICPFSDLPDFGSVEISYVPNKKCLELKSFKLYINAFRNIKIFHETVTEVIFKDFLDAIKPLKATIIVDMNVRGNVKTICRKFYKVSAPL